MEGQRCAKTPVREEVGESASASRVWKSFAVGGHLVEAEEGALLEVLFLSRAPECAPLKSKMIYASSKDAIKKKLTGIKHELQANCYEQVKDRRTLAEKLGGSAVISLESKPL